MRLLAVFSLIAAGCGVDKVPVAVQTDAALEQSDTSEDTFVMDVPTPDARAATRSRDATSASVVDASVSSTGSEAGVVDTGSTAASVDASTTNPETLPDAAVDEPAADPRCTGGNYLGTFATTEAGLLPGVTTSGTITLELTPIDGQDQFDVIGHVSGVSQSNGLIPNVSMINVDVRAVLDCATHQLQDGRVISTNGQMEIVVGMFEGTYSDSPPSLSGFLVAGDLLSGSVGNWSALPVQTPSGASP